MAESSTDQNPEHDSENHAAVAGAAQDETRADSAKPDTDAKQSAQIGDLQEESRRRERSTHRIAKFGFAVAFGSLAVSTLQWQVMRSQLHDAREQYEQGRIDADASAKEDKRRFDATLQEQWAAAAEQAGLMADSNQALKDTLATIQNNAASEQRMTREGMVASKAALELTQRAIIDVDSISSLDLSSVTQDGTATLMLVMRNFGALTANDVQFLINWMVRAEPLADDYAAKLSMINVSRMAVSARNTFRVPIFFTGLNPGVVADLKEERARLYVAGATVYFDGFRNRRSEFCVWLQVKNGGWTSCANNTHVE